MPQAQYTRGVMPPVEARAFDADLNFLVRWVGPLGLLARAMLAYIFIVEVPRRSRGMPASPTICRPHGVDGRLLPLVILAELGGSLLVLFGLKRRWAAIALLGFCMLTARFTRALIRRFNFRKTSLWPGAFSLWRFSAQVPGRVARPALSSEDSR
jgi:uncharacterized membrane protein YphA (DoxX/SURF4 family)